MSRRVLVFTTSVEAVTGLAALAVPVLVGRLLLGVEFAGETVVVARCFGIALLALSIAAWPGDRSVAALTPAFRAMAIYNAFIAVCLGYAGGMDGIGGPLLWPAVVIHAVVAVLMIRPHSSAPTVP